MSACAGCAADQPEGAHFCANCGTAMVTPTCGSCGSSLLPGAKFCNECGAPQNTQTPTRIPVSPETSAATSPVASRRVTSVLFGDLVGFTTLSESRDHEETRELLSRYFEECRQVIERYGGTVEKFIGDAVMAVWGVPTAHEDDAERAVRAGLELVVAVATLGQDVGVPELAMRVGIVTGEVAVTIGAEHQGMVAGDAVNTASRVQSVASPGQVWVDETTRLLTSSAITYLDAGSHRLKGKADPMPLWSVHAVVASVGGAQRADGLEAPLVGRERELRLLKELFHRVEESLQPGMVVLVGEPGLGKTRLAWEFEKYIDGLSTTVRWHSGRCVAYGEGLAFFALAEAIRPRLRALLPQDDDAPEDGLAQDQTRLLERGLETYVSDEREREWIRPRLGVLLGIGSLGNFPREDLFAAWTAFLEHVGGGLPVVLVIDDAQHADDGLLHFLEHLLTAGTFPCFVVLLSRSGLLETHPSLATNRRATVSHLSALNDADVAKLLNGLVVGLPDEVCGSLVARSEGVPLFAVETVRSLIDRDLVVPRGGQYVLADSGTLDLDSIGAPASLQALIAARLDALTPAQHQLVQRGSVIGNAFTREEIGELCADLGDLDALLAGLVHQQILGRTTSRFSAEFGQYRFEQSVVQQVAYATLSRRERRALHLRVAGQTEAISDPAGDLAPIIAQHYLNALHALPDEPDVADLRARSIAQLERAALRARSLGALSDCASHLLVALDLTDDTPTRARLDSLIAWALADGGEDARTLPHAIRAQEAYDALGNPVAAGMAAAAQGSALCSAGDNAGAVAVVAPRWDALLSVPGAESALLELGKVLAMGSARVGQDRSDVLNRRIQIAERVGDREHLADALTALAISYSTMSASETATILMEAAADLARAAHQPVTLARCLSNLASEYNTFDLVKAVAAAREGVEVADQAGVAMWQYYASGNLMLGLFAAGSWDDLEPLLLRHRVDNEVAAGVEASVRLIRGEPFETPWPAGAKRNTDDPSTGAWIDLTEAHVLLMSGRPADALRQAVRASQSMFELSQVADDFVYMWSFAADLALATDDHVAITGLLDLVDTAATQLRIPTAVKAHRDRIGGLMARRDDADSAERLLRSAIDGFTAWGSAPHRARAEGELAALLRSRGHTEDAEPMMARAVATLTQLRATAWLAQITSVDA